MGVVVLRRVIGKFLNWGKLEKLLVFWFLHRNKQHLNSYDAPNQLLARLRSVPLAQITPLTPDFQWKRWEPWEGQFSNFNFNWCFVENASMKSFITEYCALAVHLRWNYAIQIEKKIYWYVAVTVTKWLPLSVYLSNTLLLTPRAVIFYEGISFNLNESHKLSTWEPESCFR